MLNAYALPLSVDLRLPVIFTITLHQRIYSTTCRRLWNASLFEADSGLGLLLHLPPPL